MNAIIFVLVFNIENLGNTWSGMVKAVTDKQILIAVIVGADISQRRACNLSSRGESSVPEVLRCERGVCFLMFDTRPMDDIEFHFRWT